MRTGIRAGRSAFFPCLIRVPSVARLSPYRRDSPLQFLSTPWLKKVRSGIAGQTRGRPYGDRRVAAGRAAAEVPKLELGNQKKLELGNQKSAWEPEIRVGTRSALWKSEAGLSGAYRNVIPPLAWRVGKRGEHSAAGESDPSKSLIVLRNNDLRTARPAPRGLTGTGARGQLLRKPGETLDRQAGGHWGKSRGFRRQVSGSSVQADCG